MTTLSAPTGLHVLQVHDDVLADPEAYRAWALAQPFQTIQTGDEFWHGIALVEDRTLADLVAARMPGARTHLTFFRQSPEGQAEPNFIHSDEGMGEWTAILYLNPTPAEGDGTAFWRYRPTGEIAGSARALPKDPALWESCGLVEARFGRLVIFDSWLFHSRAIEANYGAGEDARLIQVAFGTWPPC
jgi:hypothetical protein